MPFAIEFGTVDQLVELIPAALDGQHAAWTTLIDRFDPLISAVLRRYRLSRSDAEDIRQTVWVRVVENLGRLREPRALPGWIVTVTRNEAVHLVRALNRVHPVNIQLDDRLGGIDTAEPDEQLRRTELQELVRAGLAELSPGNQALLRMLFGDEEISYQQISNQLGISTGSIGPTRKRCLQKLRCTAQIASLDLDAA